jgi:SPP1 gp7 family putative phage head morphogenesis protein
VPKVTRPGAIRWRRQLDREAEKLRRALLGKFASIIRREVRLAVELRGVSQLRKALTGADEEEILSIIDGFSGPVYEEATSSITRRPKRMRGDPATLQFLQSKYPHLEEWFNEGKIDIASRIRAVLNEAIAGEEVLTLQQITRNLHESLRETGAFSEARAEIIARTEIAQAQNAGIQQGISEAGIKKIEWLTVIDDRTRDDHIAMDGKVTEVGTPFVLPDGTRLMYPCALGGPPEHVVNCRCTFAPAE